MCLWQKNKPHCSEICINQKSKPHCIQILQQYCKQSNNTSTNLKCECGKNFFTAAELKIHTKFAHAMDIKKHVINYEKDKTFNIETKTLNMKTVIQYQKNTIDFNEENKNYICIMCREIFGQKSDLIKHIGQIHEKYFKCLHCEAMFNKRNEITIHMKKIHKDNLNFEGRHEGTVHVLI